MVKVGFIVEGGCERIVLKSTAFLTYLTNQGIHLVGDIVDMDGKGNLKPGTRSRRMEIQVQGFWDIGADWIVVLRDLDEEASREALDRVKDEVYQSGNLIVCLAIQELEAWFLADSSTLSVLLGSKFTCDYPQKVNKPADHLSTTRLKIQGRGIKDKKGFATAMVNNGFTIEGAAGHSNCPSARYFLNKLQTIASAN